MKAQLKSMGLSLDWAASWRPASPTYYRHQQKMFLDFWKAGLAYAAEAGSTGTRSTMTVLANEQVIDGRLALRRGGRAAQAHPVVPQDHDFADELLRPGRPGPAGRRRCG